MTTRIEDLKALRCAMRASVMVAVLALAACGSTPEVPPGPDTGWAGPDAGGCLAVGLETQGKTVAAAAALCCTGACVVRYEAGCTTCPGFCCTKAGGACAKDSDCCSTKCNGTSCVAVPAGGTCWDDSDCTGVPCDHFKCR